MSRGLTDARLLKPQRHNMKKIALIAGALAASTSLAIAEDTPEKNPATDVQSKVMNDQPGTKGGTTDMPIAKPESGGLADKAAVDHPGADGGTTATPTAKPESSGLAEKAMKDHPATPQ